MNASHHTDHGFQNLSVTPQLAEGYSMLKLMRKFFTRPKTVWPSENIPSVKTDLKSYYSKQPTIIWFGHSSYLIHCDGINILIDPVFSGHASPFSWYLKAFEGSDVYKPVHMPPVDIMIITHNHYDHLDIETVKKLSPQTKHFIMPLGVSTHLKSIVTDEKKITELDWWQSISAQNNIEIIAAPARHFSGRGLKRNETLWASFIILINGYRIFIGSDSGYDEHFKMIGNRYGPFDIAILECGQYNAAWPYIHSMPEELTDEARDLNAKVILPVHWGKFALALHDWDEPIKRFVAAADKANISYTTPMIGEPVILDSFYPKQKWWEEIQSPTA